MNKNDATKMTALAIAGKVTGALTEEFRYTPMDTKLFNEIMTRTTAHIESAFNDVLVCTDVHEQPTDFNISDALNAEAAKNARLYGVDMGTTEPDLIGGIIIDKDGVRHLDADEANAMYAKLYGGAFDNHDAKVVGGDITSLDGCDRAQATVDEYSEIDLNTELHVATEDEVRDYMRDGLIDASEPGRPLYQGRVLAIIPSNETLGQLAIGGDATAQERVETLYGMALGSINADIRDALKLAKDTVVEVVKQRNDLLHENERLTGINTRLMSTRGDYLSLLMASEVRCEKLEEALTECADVRNSWCEAYTIARDQRDAARRHASRIVAETRGLERERNEKAREVRKLDATVRSLQNNLAAWHMATDNALAERDAAVLEVERQRGQVADMILERDAARGNADTNYKRLQFALVALGKACDTLEIEGYHPATWRGLVKRGGVEE